jgi:hypothetical protein
MNRTHSAGASPAEIAFAQLSKVTRLGLFALVPLFAALPARGLIIENNCPDSGSAKPMPKRLETACDDPAFPSGFWAFRYGADPTTGEFFVGFTKNAASAEKKLYYGLSKVNGTGGFDWSYVVPRGELQPSSFNSHRYVGVQSRETDAGQVLCLGVYSDTSGTMTAVFEWELPFEDRQRLDFTELEDGTILVALDKIESVVILALSPIGKLSWSKEYSSADFPIPPGSDSDRRWVTLAGIRGRGAILRVSSSESRGRGHTSRTALMRIDSKGEPQWARTFQIPSSLETSGAMPFWSRTGATVFIVPELATGKGLNFKTRTVLLKISAGGELEWGRSLEGLTFTRFGGINDAGEVVLSLTSMKISTSGVKSWNVFVVIDPKGEISSAVRVDLPRSGFAGPVRDLYLTGDKIYYEGKAGGKDESYSAVIGSSSRSLTDFRWLRYKNRVPLCETGMARLPQDRLVFWAHSVKSHWTDFVTLDADLTAKADCKLFSPAPVTVSDANIPVHPVEARAADIKVQVKQLPLTLKETNLVFKKMSFSEKDLCRPDA